MHDPPNGPPIPAPFDVLPCPSRARYEDAERTVRWDIIDRCEFDHCLPGPVIDDTMVILDFQNRTFDDALSVLTAFSAARERRPSNLQTRSNCHSTRRVSADLRRGMMTMCFQLIGFVISSHRHCILAK